MNPHNLPTSAPQLAPSAIPAMSGDQGSGKAAWRIGFDLSNVSFIEGGAGGLSSD